MGIGGVAEGRREQLKPCTFWWNRRLRFLDQLLQQRLLIERIREPNRVWANQTKP
jgi:hypothetical protein